ncbi:MAG: PAAR domain-containing protein [Ilumatobacter sp.]|uniref:PAAR domain-containing protein n=1 Tax=Ilumatobacter sp. TaxID=1967498 RepID=UPI00262D652F|nr:PAAR domain-containing protein [Ilumatobacter sp.]MDJ0770653.1 PAAR domain-containing protein [Ilumatobacter sp.]
MGSPAAVQGDLITATCTTHQVPNPSSGAPQPGPPMPFSAGVELGLEPTVLIGNKPAVVVGSTGLNKPPHVGLHATDPHAVPNTQIGAVVEGSPTVLFGGKPAGRTGSKCTVCFGVTGTLTGTAATVQIA